MSKIEFARELFPQFPSPEPDFEARSRAGFLSCAGACSKGGEIEGNFHDLSIGWRHLRNNPANSVIASGVSCSREEGFCRLTSSLFRPTHSPWRTVCSLFTRTIFPAELM